MKVRRATPLLLCAAVAAICAPAKADYVISFDNLNLTNTTANPGFMNVAPSGSLVGTLTAVQANFIIEAGQTGGVWASDLGVYITNLNTVQTAADGGVGLYQAGGFNTWGSAEYSAWGTGNSGTAGTAVVTTLNLVNPITFNGDASDPNVMLAHLWNSNSQATWTGTITLVGLTAIPAPSALLALSLGCIGLVGRRRR